MTFHGSGMLGHIILTAATGLSGMSLLRFVTCFDIRISSLGHEIVQCISARISLGQRHFGIVL